MDFLDPKAKKIRNIRLIAGYILVFILIITSSLILVFSAYGFDVDRKTGQVIQNGLLYVDSAPDNANIYLNGEPHKDQTNAKLSLPEGPYQLQIKKDGYRDWQRTFQLEGGEVERVTYPFLVPNDIQRSEEFDYGTNKPLVKTQSPDRRWLLSAVDKSFLNFDEYDLNNFDKDTNQPVKDTLTFPADVYSATTGARSIKVIEWSRDNRNFLIKHTFGEKSEFIVLNRDNPTKSFNINKLLGVSPDKVTLNDKKADRWYLYFNKGGVLQRADKNNKITDVLSNVTAYETYGSDNILYAQKSAEKGFIDVSILRDTDRYMIKKVAAGTVKLNLTQYDGDWYAAIGSNGDKNTYVYKDPVSAVKDNPDMAPAPVSIIHADQKINAVEFSANTQFLMSRNGRSVGIYDADKDDRYEFQIPLPIDKGTDVEWMDGHRLIYSSGGKTQMINFLGLNPQELVSSLPGESAFFDRDYKILYTFSADDGNPENFGLYVNHLRLEADR